MQQEYVRIRNIDYESKPRAIILFLSSIIVTKSTFNTYSKLIHPISKDQFSTHRTHSSSFPTTIHHSNPPILAIQNSGGCDGGDGLSHNDHVSDPGGPHGAAFVKAGAVGAGATTSINIDNKEEDFYSFNVITLCHAGIAFTLNSILRQNKAETVYVNNTNNSMSTHSTPSAVSLSDETSKQARNEQYSCFLHLSSRKSDPSIGKDDTPYFELC